MLVRCMMCKKELDIDKSDPQYQRFLEKKTQYYICTPCNIEMKKEAISSSGIDPSSLDPKGYDKLIP